MENLLNKYGKYVLILIILMMSIKSCSDSRELTKIRKEVTTIQKETYKKNELSVLLQIEGLKSEKRMIQSTKRVLMDLNRQNEIDSEIKKLEKTLK